MAKKFLQGVDLKAQHGRNGFDMSYQNQFTAPFGMILPFFFQRVNPNDKIKLANETQTICDGLARPAFMRLKEHLDYYFIPATQLWMPFDNFVTGQNSYFSKIVSDKQDSKVPADVPCINLDMIHQLFVDWGTNQETDDLGFDYRVGAVRLFDLLGYFNMTKIAESGFIDFGDYEWTDNTQKMNLFPLLCYQKVYYDYFRNPKYEDNFVGAYNIDDYKSGFVLQTLGDDSDIRLKEIFKIHYRWQKKDYFTQTQPNILVDSSQIGYDGITNVSFTNLFRVPGMAPATPTVVDSTSSVNAGNYVRTGGVSNQVSSPTVAGIQSGGVSVSNIRFAFAYDKLLRRMREAGADFDAQMLAQFGVTPYDARHGKCTYIGGYTNNLTTKDVTNMTGEDIGDLAGQINQYSDNSKRVLKYHAKEHGYIIGVYSTSCENMYQSYRSSREVLLRNRFDWFNPAFENLGLQPVFAAERDYTYPNPTIQPTPDKGKDFDVNSYANIIGYVPRYSELKTSVDECHGVLCDYSDITGMKEWNVQLNTAFINSQVLNKTNMLLNPHQFDNVSAIPYDGRQTTDHFVVNMYNHSHKVSNMSVFEDF